MMNVPACLTARLSAGHAAYAGRVKLQHAKLTIGVMQSQDEQLDAQTCSWKQKVSRACYALP